MRAQLPQRHRPISDPPRLSIIGCRLRPKPASASGLTLWCHAGKQPLRRARVWSAAAAGASTEPARTSSLCQPASILTHARCLLRVGAGPSLRRRRGLVWPGKASPAAADASAYDQVADCLIAALRRLRRRLLERLQRPPLGLPKALGCVVAAAQAAAACMALCPSPTCT